MMRSAINACNAMLRSAEQKIFPDTMYKDLSMASTSECPRSPVGFDQLLSF